MPLGKVEQRCLQALDEAEQSGVRSLAVTAYRVLARVAAQRDDLKGAMRYLDQATSEKGEQSESLIQGTDYLSRGLIELLSDDLPAAERTLRAGYQKLEEMGGNLPLVNVAAMLARVRLLQGFTDDAEEFTRTCERLAAPDQADAQVKLRSIRAVAVARRGDPGEAERLAREAVYLASKTDQLESRAEAHADLAEVLLLSGRGREAIDELDRAAALFKEKGNEIGHRRAARLLARTS
jgi:tetratricopeptide (TPR) repeat protein